MTERMNMLRIATPQTSERIKTFDPDTEITERDWNDVWHVCNNVKSSRDGNDRWRVVDHFLPLSILKPDHAILKEADGAPVPLSTSLGIRFDMWDNFIKSQAYNKQMGVASEITEDSWVKLAGYVHGLRNGRVIDHLAEAIALAYISDPAHESLLDPTDHDPMLEELAEQRGRIVSLDHAAQLAAYMRILELDFPPFSEAEWSSMRTMLQSYKDTGMYEDFLQMAASMKMLAAEKVEVTEKGLAITMPARNRKDDSGIADAPESLAMS